MNDPTPASYRGWLEWDEDTNTVFADGHPLPAVNIRHSWTLEKDPRRLSEPAFECNLPLENGLWPLLTAWTESGWWSVLLLLQETSDPAQTSTLEIAREGEFRRANHLDGRPCEGDFCCGCAIFRPDYGPEDRADLFAKLREWGTWRLVES